MKLRELLNSYVPDWSSIPDLTLPERLQSIIERIEQFSDEMFNDLEREGICVDHWVREIDVTLRDLESIKTEMECEEADNENTEPPDTTG